MKKCPKCKAEYFDNMLDFCLEDGIKLLYTGTKQNTPQTPAASSAPATVTKTAVLKTDIFDGNLDESETRTIERKNLRNEINSKKEFIKETVKEKSYKVLELTPIVLALAHNYWQWLYLSRQTYYEFTSFVFSPAFLMWLALLLSGVIFGIISIKYGRNKTFAITALVVLGINFLLYIVPK